MLLLDPWRHENRMFSPDGHLIAAMVDSKFARIHDSHSGHPLVQFPLELSWVHNIPDVTSDGLFFLMMALIITVLTCSCSRRRSLNHGLLSHSTHGLSSLQCIICGSVVPRIKLAPSSPSGYMKRHAALLDVAMQYTHQRQCYRRSQNNLIQRCAVRIIISRFPFTETVS